MRNKITDLLDYLIEGLRDIPAGEKNVHYTNALYLYRIIKSGFLKGKEYYASHTNAYNKTPNAAEISTTRSPNIKYDVKNGLSSSIDNVKIILYTDRILSGVRHAKIEPVSEIVKQSNKDIETYIKRLKKSWNIAPPKFIRENVINSFRKGESVNKIIGSSKLEISKWVDDNCRFTDNRMVKLLLTSYAESIAIGMQYGMNREREERIVVDKSRGIPVDDKFMKIEFDSSSINEDWIDEIRAKIEEMHDFTKEDFISTIKDCRVIVKDKNFNSVIKQLETEL